MQWFALVVLFTGVAIVQVGYTFSLLLNILSVAFINKKDTGFHYFFFLILCLQGHVFASYVYNFVVFHKNFAFRKNK